MPEIDEELRYIIQKILFYALLLISCKHLTNETIGLYYPD